MLKATASRFRDVLEHVACCLLFLGTGLAAMVGRAQASPSCDAVNAGAFNLTNTALGPASSSILFAWADGDKITLTLASADGISRTDGFYHGSTFAAGTFGPLEQV